MRVAKGKDTIFKGLDYYPFGMEKPGRTFSSGQYKYGFGSEEKDDEIKGDGNSYNFGARMYDPRIGRWFKVDNYSAKYADVSPYSYALNNPIFLIDPSGDTVIVHVKATKVGTTEINLFSSDEIKADATLKTQTKDVNVYEVNVTNQSGSSATFYYTRLIYRGKKDGKDVTETEVTFDVENDGDKFLGKIKSRWSGTDNVLELRALNDIDNQTVSGRKGNTKADRTAIQFHLKGASDGCLLCVGKDQFESKESGITITETDLKSNSSDTQSNFMTKIKDYQKADKAADHSDVIIIKFDQLYKDETTEDKKTE